MSTPSLPDALLAALDEPAPTHVVHVGGGDGAVLAALLTRLPAATGALVDLPEAVAGAGAVLEAAGVADRADVVATGPDDPIPPGGDLYVVSGRDVPLLLARCRAVMAPAARLVEVGGSAPD